MGKGKKGKGKKGKMERKRKRKGKRRGGKRGIFRFSPWLMPRSAIGLST